MNKERWDEIIETLEALFDNDENNKRNIITEDEGNIIISVLKNNIPF